MSVWRACYSKKDKTADIRFITGGVMYDDLMIDDGNHQLLLEGVLLNLGELETLYGKHSAKELFAYLLEKQGKELIKELRGCFTGVIYDKREKRFYAFANQTGDTAAFICNTEEYCIVSNYLKEGILELLWEKDVPYSYDETAAKYLLTYGFMIDDTTHFQEIKRIMPGYCAVYDAGTDKLTRQRYHSFTNENQLNITLETAIELVDEGFRKAVKRCFDKDNEKLTDSREEWHLADMSAGLDSRMTSWIANKLGYKNVINICYAQSGSQEEKIAGRIATYLGNDFYFQYLDAANFIYDIDEMVQLNYGLSYYAASTGSRRFLKLLHQTDKLEHSGQIGDVVVGSFAKTAAETVNKRNGRYSDSLKYDFADSWYTKELNNDEMFCMYTRGFLGALSSHIIRRNYTYTVSPFMDVDFLELCLSIPTEMRANHRLYYAWIEQCYPDARNIPSTRDRLPLPKRIKNKGFRELRKIFCRLGITKSEQSRNSMNPMEYWYQTNNSIQEFINGYYQENIERCRTDGIYEDIKRLFANGNVIEKLMILTVLAVKKQYFNGKSKER